MLPRKPTKAISWTSLVGGKSGSAASKLFASANPSGTRVRARLQDPVPATFFAIKPTRRRLGEFLKRITRGGSKSS